MKSGEWNDLPCGGAVLLDADGRPVRLSDGGVHGLTEWCVDNGVWLCERQAMLGGQNGTVEIERL